MTSTSSAGGNSVGRYKTHAEDFVSRSKFDPYLGSFGVLLNYSLASLAALDVFLDETWGRDGEAPNDETYKLPPGKLPVAIEFGSYLGEVIRRALGGEWEIDPAKPNNPYSAKVKLPQGGFVAPIYCVYLRFKNGEKESLCEVAQNVIGSKAPHLLAQSAQSFIEQADAFLNSRALSDLDKKAFSDAFRKAAEQLASAKPTSTDLSDPYLNLYMQFSENWSDAAVEAAGLKKPEMFELEPSVETIRETPKPNPPIASPLKAPSANAEEIKKSSFEKGVARALQKQEQERNARKKRKIMILCCVGGVGLLLGFGIWKIAKTMLALPLVLVILILAFLLG